MINSKANEGSQLNPSKLLLSLKIVLDQKAISKEHQFIPIATAYNNALNDSKHPDVGLEEKKKLIVEQIANIQDKIKQIKVNAESIQQQITRILEETINSLMQVVQQKSAILKSD